jgi:hypothetical protein
LYCTHTKEQIDKTVVLYIWSILAIN